MIYAKKEARFCRMNEDRHVHPSPLKTKRPLQCIACLLACLVKINFFLPSPVALSISIWELFSFLVNRSLIIFNNLCAWRRGLNGWWLVVEFRFLVVTLCQQLAHNLLFLLLLWTTFCMAIGGLGTLILVLVFTQYTQQKFSLELEK